MIVTIAEVFLHEAKRFVRITKCDAVAEPYGYTVEYGTFDPDTHREQTRWHSEPMHGDTRAEAEASMQRMLRDTFEEGVALKLPSGYPHLPTPTPIADISELVA